MNTQERTYAEGDYVMNIVSSSAFFGQVGQVKALMAAGRYWIEFPYRRFGVYNHSEIGGVYEVPAKKQAVAASGMEDPMRLLIHPPAGQ